MKKFISSLIANTQDRRKRGFTLIELLIVIGILGILVVAVLLTLNPAEAQRKTRDAKRMKDSSTIQSFITQYIDNGGVIAAGQCTAAAGCTSASGLTAVDGTGWIPLVLSPYVSTLPLDPTNNTTRAAVAAGGTCPTGVSTTANVNTLYRIRFTTGADYEINVRQESWANCKNTYDDGGNDDSYVEVYSNPTLNLF